MTVTAYAPASKARSANSPRASVAPRRSVTLSEQTAPAMTEAVYVSPAASVGVKVVFPHSSRSAQAAPSGASPSASTPSVTRASGIAITGAGAGAGAGGGGGAGAGAGGGAAAHTSTVAVPPAVRMPASQAVTPASSGGAQTPVPDRSSAVRAVRSVHADGMLPDSPALPLRSRLVSAVSRPTAVGAVPDRPLPERSSAVTRPAPLVVTPCQAPGATTRRRWASKFPLAIRPDGTLDQVQCRRVPPNVFAVASAMASVVAPMRRERPVKSESTSGVLRTASAIRSP